MARTGPKRKNRKNIGERPDPKAGWPTHQDHEHGLETVDTDAEIDLSPEGVELTAQEIQAIQMRKGGATFSQIAEVLDLANRSVAFKMVRRALQRWGVENVAEYRVLELARLDDMTRLLWPDILGRRSTDGSWEVPPDRDAMQLYLRVSERRSKLLGLDAPQGIEIMPTGAVKTAGESLVEDYEKMRTLVEGVAESLALDRPSRVIDVEAVSDDGDDDADED